MSEIGRILLVLGLAVAVVGAVFWGLGLLGFRGMPGDIRVEGERFRFYFPIVTCIAVSITLSGAIWLWRWFTQK